MPIFAIIGLAGWNMCEGECCSAFGERVCQLIIGKYQGFDSGGENEARAIAFFGENYEV